MGIFDDISYEMILQRMLDRVSTNVDKREGSIIYDALAPAAFEMKMMLMQLDWIMNQTFVDTSDGEYLVRRVAERGIFPNPATKAILRGVFTPDNINLTGKRFNTQNSAITYVAKQLITPGIYQMECETPGIIGNQGIGTIVPIDYVLKLETAELTDILIPGEDEEDSEHLRERYIESLNAQSFGGNIQDYVERTEKISGVGGVKVYPTWDGGGTVKIIFLNSDFQKPSNILIDEVQSVIDPVINQGIGMGIAPIGHVVTIEGVEETEIDVVLHLAFESGYDWEQVEPAVINAIETYFLELSSEWHKVNWRNDPSSTLVVRISQLETRILNLIGIIDIQNTLLNGVNQNFVLNTNAIPIRGEVTNE